MTTPLVHANVVNEDDDHADVEDAQMFSEDDTKKSFDFTGRLQKLNESGGSHRLSFVENVFCTPAAIDPRYDFDLQLCGTQPLPQDPVVASGAGTRWGYDIERSHGPRVTGVFARRILDGCGH